MSLVLGAFALTGCNGSDVEQNPARKGKFTFTVAQDAMTRATVEKYNVVWQRGDEIAFGVPEHGTTDSIAKAFKAQFQSDNKFTIDTTLDDTKSYDFYALYPWQGAGWGANFNLSTKLKDPDRYSAYINLGAKSFTQKAQEVDSAMKLAPMYGCSTVGSPAAYASVSLHHLAAMLEFNVVNGTTAPVRFSSLKMSVPDSPAFCGTWYVSLDGELTPSKDDKVYNESTVAIEGGSDEYQPGTGCIFYIPVKGGTTFAAGSAVEFTVTTVDGASCKITKHIPAAGSVTFAAGSWNTQELSYTGPNTTSSTMAEVIAAGPGSYDVENVTVYAQSGTNYIVGDATGKMLLFKTGSTPTLNNGDIISMSGNVVLYYGILEWDNPTVTVTGQASSIDHGTATEFDAASFHAYSVSPRIEYLKVSGNYNKRNITSDYDSVYYASANTGVTIGDTWNDKDVVCYGYAYGFYSSKRTISLLVTDISEDTSIPSLELSPETLSFAASETGDSKSVTMTYANTTITSYTSDASWCLVERVGDLLYVTATEQNTTGATRTATVTVTTAAGLSKTITVTQAPAATGTTIAGIYASGPGNYSLTGVTVYAVNTNKNGPQNVIIGDGTGFMLVYQPTVTGAESLVAGHIADISGPVYDYHGNYAIVYEFTKRDEVPVQMTVTGTATSLVYPTPVTLTSAQYEALKDPAKILPIQYLAISGVYSSSGSSVTTDGGDVYSVTNGDGVAFTDMNDKKVNCTGFTFGITQAAPGKVKAIFTSAELDNTAPSLTVSPTALSFEAEEAGSDAAKEVSCTVENTTLTTAVASESWLTAEISVTNAGVVTVYPTSANTSTSARTATVTINTVAGLSKTVSVSQAGKTSGDALTVTYTFTAATDYPSGFPTSNGTSTSSPTAFTFNGTNQLTIYAPNGYYMINHSSVYSLFFGKSSSTFANSAYLEIPAKSGYTISKVVITNGVDCAVNVAVNIFDASGNAKSTAVNTVKSGTMTFDLTGAAANTAYRISSTTNNKNFQFDKIVVTYSK